MSKQKPLVSPEELEALIQGWGEHRDARVDRFFPLRAFLVSLVAVGFIYARLFEVDWFATQLVAADTDLPSMNNLLISKGLVALLMFLVGLHTYVRNWHPGVVFSILFCVAASIFINDLFVLYSHILREPTPIFTITIMARLLILWFLFGCARNSGRIPPFPDCLNPFLFLKK